MPLHVALVIPGKLGGPIQCPNRPSPTKLRPSMSWFRRTTQSSEDLDRVKSEIARLDESIRRHDERAKQFEDALAGQPDGTTALNGRVAAIAEQLTALESRLSSVSTELVNQLSELGNDIEALNNRPPGAPLDEGTIDELRDTQTRLASEQARYQIAFREDLARLAEQLRRPADPRRRA